MNKMSWLVRSAAGDSSDIWDVWLKCGLWFNNVCSWEGKHRADATHLCKMLFFCVSLVQEEEKLIQRELVSIKEQVSSPSTSMVRFSWFFNLVLHRKSVHSDWFIGSYKAVLVSFWRVYFFLVSLSDSEADEGAHGENYLLWNVGLWGFIQLHSCYQTGSTGHCSGKKSWYVVSEFVKRLKRCLCSTHFVSHSEFVCGLQVTSPCPCFWMKVMSCCFSLWTPCWR